MGEARASRPVTLAVITGAHGVTGEVRLKIFAESLSSIKRFKTFNDGRLSLQSLRPNKDGAIARFAEVADRNAAEALRGTELSVPRAALPPLGAGEYYHVDLIGLAAVSTEDAALGEVIAVENFGAGDVLEIRRPDGKTFMVPIHADAVPEWDVERVLIHPDFVQ